MGDLTLYLIRHGESVQNTKPDMIGQEPDEPLSKTGEAQAKALGRYFSINNINFDLIFCSSYARAHSTARIACQQFTDQFPVIVPELREYSAGDMKGSKRSEVLTPDIVAAMENLGMLFKFPNGESLYEVQQRASRWLYDVVLSAPYTKSRKVALFSHGMTIKCLLQYVMQFDQKMTWRVTLDNTSVSVLEFKSGLWFIKSINDTKHLAQLGD